MTLYFILFKVVQLFAVFGSDAVTSLTSCYFLLPNFAIPSFLSGPGMDRPLASDSTTYRWLMPRGITFSSSQIFIRNLLRMVDSIPLLYLFGGCTCLLTSKSQRLGDIAANTIVVRITEKPLPDIRQLKFEETNSLREHPSLVARLRRYIPKAAAAFSAGVHVAS